MKIRCGSHQQNRSIVRPGLSLMAAKVALTAEEFRENSQRSIALFNTEKLSTNSTHVLKSAYCNSVHFCRCNLHGACGGKGWKFRRGCADAGCNLHGACGGKVGGSCILCNHADVAICTERVEAKVFCGWGNNGWGGLQSARSVWRQSWCFRRVQIVVSLQSARSVWRQRLRRNSPAPISKRCNLHGACGGKGYDTCENRTVCALQSARSVWRQRSTKASTTAFVQLQSARSVWRQRLRSGGTLPRQSAVAICTERVEAKINKFKGGWA